MKPGQCRGRIGGLQHRPADDEMGCPVGHGVLGSSHPGLVTGRVGPPPDPGHDDAGSGPQAHAAGAIPPAASRPRP